MAKAIIEPKQQLGAKGLEALRTIVRDKQAGKVNGIAVDLFTASAVVRVIDKVSESNRERLLAMPTLSAIRVCMAVFL